MFWATNVSMFALLPLAYFYHEAAGFGTRWKSALWRMNEAVLLWLIFSAISGGFVYLARSLYTTSQSSPDYSPFAYSLMSLIGSFFILWYTPGGIVVMGRASTNLFRTYKVLVTSSRQELLLEQDALKFKLFKLEKQQRLGEETPEARFSSSLTHSGLSSHQAATIPPPPQHPYLLEANSNESGHASAVIPPNPTATIWTKFSLLPTARRAHQHPRKHHHHHHQPHGSNSIMHRFRNAGGGEIDARIYTHNSSASSNRSLQRALFLQQQLIRKSSSKNQRIATWEEEDAEHEYRPPSPSSDFIRRKKRSKQSKPSSTKDLDNSMTKEEMELEEKLRTAIERIPTSGNLNGEDSYSREEEEEDEEDENEDPRGEYEDEDDEEDELIIDRHETITPELLNSDAFSSRTYAEGQHAMETLRWVLQHGNSIANAAAASERNSRRRFETNSSSSVYPRIDDPQYQPTNDDGDDLAVPDDNNDSDDEDEPLLTSRSSHHNSEAVVQEVDWLEAQSEYAFASRRLKIVQRELAKYEQEPEQVTILSSIRWLLRNLLALVLSAINLVLPLLLFIRAIDIQLRPYIATEGAVYYYSFLSPDGASSTVWFTSEIALILYITVAAFSGLLTSPLMARFRPRHHATGMHKILVCIYFGLVVASALPVTGRLLGLISFDLMGAYDNLEYLQSKVLASFMQTLFALLLVKRYLEFFPWTNSVYQAFFRALDWANRPFALR